MKWPSFVCFILLLISCNRSNDITTPTRKDMVQVVYASGKVYPLNHVRIASKVTGYVGKVLVRTGDTVQAGMPIAIVTDPNAMPNVAIAQSDVRLAEQDLQLQQSRLAAARQDVASSLSKYQLDSTEAVRYENLWKQDIGTRSQVDQAITRARLSRSAYMKALNESHALEDKLHAAADNAKGRLQVQVNNSNEHVIRAPFSGRIYDVPVKEGQLLTIGSYVADMGDAASFEVELEVDEADVGMLQTGQEVILSVEAYDTIPVRTTVREIYPSVSAGSKTTTVKASIPADALRWYAGMSVEANIITARRQQVLVIPTDYLNADNTVILRKDKKKVPVRTGIRDMQFVEILSGIDANTELMKAQ